MTNGQYDNKTFSSADILRYLSGEMSPEERHALERQSLEDPFLADAIEGMEQRETPDLQQDLNVIAHRLDERLKEKKKTVIAPFYRVAAAAAVFLLAGSLSIIYFLNQANDAGPDTVANELQTRKFPLSALDTSADKKADKKEEIATITSPGGATSPTPPSNQQMFKSGPIMPAPQKDATVLTSKESDKQKPVQQFTPLVIAPDQEATRSYSLRETAPGTSDSKSLSEPRNAMIMKRKSTDTAVVVGYGSTRKTDTSSITGYSNARKPMPLDSFPSRQLAEVQIDQTRNVNGDQVVRALEGKAAGVAVSKAPKRQASANISISPVNDDSLTFKPAASWQEYASYLQRNLKTEQQDGEILVQFRIDASGKPKDTKILQSISRGLNTKIRRLINNGPLWQLTPGASDTVKVLIRF